MEEHFDSSFVPRSEPKKNNYNKVLWVIAALMLFILASNIFLIVDSHYEKLRYAEYKNAANAIYDSVAFTEV